MQNTDKTSSVENIRPSSSLPARRTQVGYLLIAALAALEAGLTASLMAVVLMGVWRLAAGIPTPVELFGDHVLKLLSAGPFVQLLIEFAPNSKTAPLGLTLLGMHDRRGDIVGVALCPCGACHAACKRLSTKITRMAHGGNPGNRNDTGCCHIVLG